MFDAIAAGRHGQHLHVGILQQQVRRDAAVLAVLAGAGA
jgi:hypothetical protein